MAHTSYSGVLSAAGLGEEAFLLGIVLRAALGPKGKGELQKCCLTWSTYSRRSRWDVYYTGSVMMLPSFSKGK